MPEHGASTREYVSLCTHVHARVCVRAYVRTHPQRRFAAKVAPCVRMVVALLLVDGTCVGEMRAITLVARAFGVRPTRVRPCNFLAPPPPCRRAHCLAHFRQHSRRASFLHLPLVGCRKALQAGSAARGGGGGLACVSALPFVGMRTTCGWADQGEGKDVQGARQGPPAATARRGKPLFSTKRLNAQGACKNACLPARKRRPRLNRPRS
jgi:hypothetical protein